jgi:hypothetical protein
VQAEKTPMNTKELYDFSIQDFEKNLDIEQIHPLHKAILEECCENALNNPQKITDEKTLKYAVHVAFLTSLSTLVGTLKSGLEMADTINLNYRNNSYEITKDSPLLKNQ